MWGIFRTYINAGGNTRVFPPLCRRHQSAVALPPPSLDPSLMQMLQSMSTKLDACMESNTRLEARLAAVESRPAAPSSPITPVPGGAYQGRSAPRQPRACWNCGIVGHLAYQCPKTTKPETIAAASEAIEFPSDEALEQTEGDPRKFIAVMVAKNAEQQVLTEKQRLGLERRVNRQKSELAKKERRQKRSKKKKEDSDGDLSSSRSRRSRHSKKKKKGASDGTSSHSVDSLTPDHSDDEDFWQGPPQALMTPTPETPTLTKDATLVVAVTNPISGHAGAPGAEPYSDLAPELDSDSSSSNGSSRDSDSEEGDTEDFEGTTPPSCPAGCSDPACTQDHPEDYPVVAYAEESSDSDGCDTDDDTLLGGRTASINQASTPPHNNTNVGGPVHTRGFDSPSRYSYGYGGLKLGVTSWCSPFTLCNLAFFMLLTILGACYWQHWAAAVAAAAYDTAVSWASWAPSQDYQWVNDLLQQIHLPREVLSDSVQQFSGTVGVESEHTLTLTAQAILTLRAEASPLQAGYEYLLGVVAVTTAWSFLQAASLAARWYHGDIKRAYCSHFSDRRTRQITRVKPMQVHRLRLPTRKASCY